MFWRPVDLRFDTKFADRPAISVFDVSTTEFLKCIPLVKVEERLKGILARSGLRTGAEAQI